jgi:citrate synthase
MSYEKEYVRSLRDVATCETRNSFVDPLGALYYMGYDIERFLGRVCYEEAVHLLLYKRLPSESELNPIRFTLTSEMKLPEEIIRSIRDVPKTSHPMEILRTEISHLGEYDPDPNDISESASLRRCLMVIAKVPTLVATIYRVRSNQELVHPKKEWIF